MDELTLWKATAAQLRMENDTLKKELARCRLIIGDLQTRHITTKRERDEYKRTLDAINQWAAASTTEAA